MKARVTVYPRREILDPQGKAIRDALSRVGFPGVADVRAGKSFEIELGTEDPQAADRQLRDMCEKLLANTVVEDYSVELLAGSEGVRP
ncbi:MAG TPA: phosphoribosylformylglycinamidine synthase subunit PurS [Thermoanaerobaculia bacterium]|nr:phosphoribosylformylglycinamidine synthase subunit PurS [Thermoanaerobaculia bacterium]